MRPRVTRRAMLKLPTLVRQDDRVTVKGSLTGATPGARAALELKRTAPGGKWTVVAHARLNRHGAFTLRWRVTKRELPGPVSLRVAGLRRSGAVLVSTLPVQSAIGPAAVDCAPATPPMVAIPVGSGWIVGGRIIQGGPFWGFMKGGAQRMAEGSLVKGTHWITLLAKYRVISSSGKSVCSIVLVNTMLPLPSSHVSVAVRS